MPEYRRLSVSHPLRKGHEYHFRRSPDHVEHDVPAFMARRDIEKHQFIGPFRLIARGHLDRIPGVAEIQKISTLNNPPAIYVKAGNNAFGEHFGRVRETHRSCLNGKMVHFMHPTDSSPS